MIGKSTRRALAVVTSLALALSGVMISDGDASAAAKVKLSATKGTIKVGATKKVTIKGTTKKNVKKLTVKTSNKRRHHRRYRYR
ncbi:MAG: hypothetical protein II526_10545 [Erysipelotrichaceae bacterium]|nr:hypothetical protein [Erysipelotrichaceae bacterium]